MIKDWPDHQPSGGGNLTQFAIVLLSNYAKIHNKVKSVMFIISDFKVIYYLLLLLVIMNIILLTWSKTKCIYTSWGITGNMTFTTIIPNRIYSYLSILYNYS